MLSASTSNIPNLPNFQQNVGRNFVRGNSYSLSPMHERYRIFKETYNSVREDIKEHIRLTKDTLFTKMLYAMYNKSYTLELKNWGDKNPNLLPSLSLNNPDNAKNVGVQANSTVYRCILALSKVDLGEGRGMLLKKQNHGKYKDYTIFINPYILTGQIVENWGTNQEKKWKKSSENQPKNETPPSALVANCNLPFITGTILKDNTTTSVCGKADNLAVAQEQETGTKEESLNHVTNPYFKAYLIAQSEKNTQAGASGSVDSSSARSEQIKGNYFGAVTSTKINQVEPKAVENVNNSVDNTQNTHISSLVRQKSFELTYDFYDYAMPILYPRHKNSCKSQKKKIQINMWHYWFRPFVENKACTIDFLYKLSEELKEMIVMTQLELDKNPNSFVHANPAVFFDANFEHGLARACKKYRENKLNQDMSKLRKAQKSLRKGIRPRGVKNINSMLELVAYWKNHLEKCTTNKALIMKSLNLFLLNPKNISKDDLK